MTTPCFSVIIDSYNLGAFIEEAIESVLAQTFPKDRTEIIVVDDGSTDDTQERVKKYSHNIQYIYKENGGQASAFNAGFMHSSGDIIVFLDADDYFHPEKLQELSHIYDTYHCDAVFHNLSVVTTKLKGPFIPYLYYHNLQLLHKIGENLYVLSTHNGGTGFMPVYFLVPTSGQSYSRRLCKKILPLPEHFTHAADLYLHLHALVGTDIYFVDRSLGFYRRHPCSDNESRRTDIVWHERRIGFYSHTLRTLEQTFHDKAARLARTVENDLHLMDIPLERMRGRYRVALKHFWEYKAPGPFLLRLGKISQALFYLIAPPRIYEKIRSLYFSFRMRNLARFIVRKYP
jgi:glycosyltransferase involved in cell wall biosynthesis